MKPGVWCQIVLSLMIFWLPDSCWTHAVQPVVLSSKQIHDLPEVGKLTPTPIEGVNSLQIADIDEDSFDEIICKSGDIIDFNEFSGHKLRRMWFPFSLHGWSVLNISELGGCCLFIFREVDNWAKMEVYDTDKHLIGSVALCPVNDRDKSGYLDFTVDVLGIVDLNGDQQGELILRLNAGYDLFPRGVLVIDLESLKIVQEIYTAGKVNEIHFTDLDSDGFPDVLISTRAPSNGARIGVWDDSKSVLIGIRGIDGVLLWRRVIGGPLSIVRHRLADFNGDSSDEILVAESSEYARKEHNTVLKVFRLPDAVEICSWECPDANMLIDDFTVWGRGENLRIVVGFDNGDLVRFDNELKPFPLYRFPFRISSLKVKDLNTDGHKEVIVGLRNETVLILDNGLRLAGKQHFQMPPIRLQKPVSGFGKFVVISNEKVYGWQVGNAEISPPSLGFITWLRRWGWYAGPLAILVIAVGWRNRRKIRWRDARIERKVRKDTLTLVANSVEQLLTHQKGENIRQAICKEILSQRKEKEVYDYFILLLGDIEIYDGKGQVRISHWRGTKWKTIFCYFLANRAHRTHKEKLMDLFWRNSKPKQAAQNLRLAVHHINQELSLPGKERFLIFTDQCYFINPKYQLYVDAEEFEHLVSSADRMMKDDRSDQAVELYLNAIRLYAGDYQMNLYETWCDQYRGYFQKLFIHAQKQVGQYLLDKGLPDRAIVFFRNAVRVDEYSEELYVDIMRCHAACGNRKAVIEEYRRLVEILREEMNTEPLSETKRIYQSLLS